ncbi:hypothetical protein [Legionella tunisiensis]|uniref:hypothetical protein n=1 Tax=Legionella tunisiensis TaxID=1034944 RepID=UPI00030111BD|nr:hypothetical protein [Legionella tunisiensis]
MANFWQYGATQRFFYGNKEQGGGYASSESTLSDWNRELTAGDGSQIRIGAGEGSTIAHLRAEKGKFQSLDDLKNFLLRYCFLTQRHQKE